MVALLGRGWWCVLICLPLIAGCDGCRLTNQPDEAGKQLDEQQPPFTSRGAEAYPATRSDSQNGDSPNGSVKPGHWTTAGLSLRSNADDRRGVVQTRANVGESPGTLVDGALAQTAPSASAEPFLVRRPAVLPKGQMRRLETRFLAPERDNQLIDSVGLEGQFLGLDSTARHDLRPARFAAMLPQTYFMVILTNRPERFNRWQTSDWVRPIQSEQSFKRSPDNYRIVIPPIQGVIPLAETALDWTSTAVLLWDDVPATALTPGQRTAILDWLNFGGLIVVNGPAGVDALTDANFRDLLPITPGGVAELLAADAQIFVRSHGVASDSSTAAVIAGLDGNSSHVAAAGDLRADAMEIGAGQLLAERRVGRGRIVQCRVDLMSSWLMPWKSYDSFVNSAVLARPPRVLRLDEIAAALATNVPIAISPEEPDVAPGSSVEIETDLKVAPPVLQTFVGAKNESVSPAINTGLRFFSRNARMRLTRNTPEAGESQFSVPMSDIGSDTPGADTGSAAGRSDEAWPHPVSGLGGWTNESDLLTWSRGQLRREIGVSIPKSSLVFRSLLIYLVVLIPLNYLVFRMLGHLEWAWLAVVPLSIAGAFWVAHASQLDIGFVRSRNELALLELPVDYPRGHLTRVVGLYNSLASRYRIGFATADAAIDVIRSSSRGQSEASLFGTAAPELELGFEAGPAMDNIAVGSNSYGVVHVEQIIDVDGAIRAQYAAPNTATRSLDGGSISNESSLELLDAFVIERDAEGATRMAALGTIGSGARKAILMQRGGSVVVPSELPMGMTDAMSRLLASDAIPVGSARLIARVEQPLGGMTIAPDCKQVRAQTLVLVHLAHAARPPVIADENLIGDVQP